MSRLLKPLLGFGLIGTLNAYAEKPPPDYRAEVSVGAWHTVNRQLEQAIQLAHEDPDAFARGEFSKAATQHLYAALRWADAFELQVFETAGLAYLKGLIWVQLDQVHNAKAEYQRSLHLDPKGVDALFDLGELHLREREYDEAKTCFQKTSQLVTTGPSAWQSSLRLAEIAGYQSQPDALEKHLRDAIQRGFPLAQLTKHPSWAALYRVPLLQDKIYKLFLVYGDVRYLRDFDTQKNPG